jgi:acyl-CoA reductase-like NAD-dependent aldehyde dehydrogenase
LTKIKRSDNHYLYEPSGSSLHTRTFFLPTAIMSTETITTISPVTNKPVVERQGPTDSELAELPKTAQKAFLKYRKTSLDERKKIVKKALDLISEREDVLAKEITEQMGRPIAYTGKEVSTAEKAFEDTPGEPEEGFKRYIKKVPLGPVLIIVPWNVSVAAVGCFSPTIVTN